MRRKLLFDSIRDSTGLGAIYSINVDGSGEKQLTTAAVNNTRAQWSPDSRHISWVQVANRHATLVEANQDGTDVRTIAENVAAGTYSPDGSQIASSGRTNDPNHWFAVTVRTDGTDKRHLVCASEGFP